MIRALLGSCLAVVVFASATPARAEDQPLPKAFIDGEGPVAGFRLPLERVWRQR